MSRWLGRGAVGLAVLCLALAYRSVFDLSLVPRMSQEPWLINHGFVVFRDIIDQHEAGLPLLLALALPLVGSPLLLVKWAFIALVVATVLLTYLAARRRAGEAAGVLAAVYLAIWTPPVFGGKLWYEVLIGALCVLSFILWSGDLGARRWRLFAAGAALGSAATVKQYAWAAIGVYVVTTVALALAEPGARRRRIGTLPFFALGVLLPYSLYLLAIAASGAFSEYVYWAWLNNFARYQGQAALAPKASDLPLLGALFLPAILPLMLALDDLRRKATARAAENVLLFGLTLAAATPVYPRFSLFHLAAALPLASLCLGVGAVRLLPTAAQRWQVAGGKGPRRPACRHWALPALVAVVALVWAAYSMRLLVPAYGRLLEPPQRLLTYQELQPVAAWVASATGPAERILVFPDDEATSHVYLLSQRLPPGIWAYTYPWYMTEAVMADTIRAMETHGVGTVVYFEGRGVDGQASEEFASPLASYIEREYRRVASLDWEQGTVHLMARRR